jgi:CcmD family protein
MTMVALAYGFIWLAVFSYVVVIGRRLARLHGEIDELRRRLDHGKT